MCARDALRDYVKRVKHSGHFNHYWCPISACWQTAMCFQRSKKIMDDRTAGYCASSQIWRALQIILTLLSGFFTDCFDGGHRFYMVNVETASLLERPVGRTLPESERKVRKTEPTSVRVAGGSASQKPKMTTVNCNKLRHVLVRTGIKYGCYQAGWPSSTGRRFFSYRRLDLSS